MFNSGGLTGSLHQFVAFQRQTVSKGPERVQSGVQMWRGARIRSMGGTNLQLEGGHETRGLYKGWRWFSCVLWCNLCVLYCWCILILSQAAVHKGDKWEVLHNLNGTLGSYMAAGTNERKVMVG